MYWLATLLIVSAGRRTITSGKLSVSSLTLVIIAILLIGVSSQAPDLSAKLISLLIYAALFALFASSLLPGKVPLITRMACLLRDIKPLQLNRKAAEYTRMATVMWATFFFLLGLASLWLALFASLNAWSIFTNFIAYILVGLMFLFEFWLRKKLIAEQMDYTMKEFFQRLRGIKMFRLFSTVA